MIEYESERPPSAQGPRSKTEHVEWMPRKPRDLCANQ